jgi:GTP-binding protein EngB required for normal cell division
VGNSSVCSYCEFANALTYHRRVFILVDVRRGIQDNDLEMMITLNDAYIPYQVCFFTIRTTMLFHLLSAVALVLQIILTKVDLVSTPELLITVKGAFDVMLSKYGGACLPFLHTVSSTKGIGIDALKLNIAQVYSHNFSNSPIVEE